MQNSARRAVVHGTASTLILLSLGGVAGAQRPMLKNIELCNGVDRTSPDIQIDGCTSLINSGKQTPQTLVIAYNNRGNAYMAKGEYDRAIQDYDQSIKLNPNLLPEPSTTAAWLTRKRVNTTAQSKTLTNRSSSIPTTPTLSRTAPETYLNKGEYERAARDYDEAIRLKPTSEAAWNGRCWSSRRSRRIAGGAGGLQRGASVGAECRRHVQTRAG